MTQYEEMVLSEWVLIYNNNLNKTNYEKTNVTFTTWYITF